LFSNDSYYLHMILQVGDQAQAVYPSGDLMEADVRQAIESALKRSASGFLQVVGLWTPPATPTQDMYGQMQQPLSSWQQLDASLRQEYEVRQMDLSNGQVPADVDVLVIAAPQGMTDQERFAIDQYLMRGGAVIVAAGNYAITLDQFSGGLGVKLLEGSLQEMLASYGIQVENSLVLDPQNEPFPVTVTRNVGGMPMQEIQAVDYPFFVDVRSDGMASGSPLVSNLPAVTLNWASPITVDEAKNADRQVTTLLQSSPASWTQEDTNILPDFDIYPDLGFPVGENQQSYPLAVAVQGSFESFFKDKPSPFEVMTDTETAAGPVAGTIDVSPDSARLVVVGSAEFVDDVVFDISSRLTQDRYLNSLKLVQNGVAWATEDTDLLDIRARGTYARVLVPMTDQQQSFWEGINYVLALVSLIVIGVVWSARRKNEPPMQLTEQ
ncbi:MAG: ABC transporter permease, partial [Chloroflexi bacterium]